MDQLIEHITAHHDSKIVILAAAVCIMASIATFVLLSRIEKRKGFMSFTWLLVATGVIGFSVWATHFIAMLAYNPGMAFSINLDAATKSLAVILCVSLPAFALIANKRSRVVSWIGVIMFGMGLSGLHYTDVDQLLPDVKMLMDQTFAAASLAAGVLLSVFAMESRRLNGRIKSKLIAAAFLSSAVFATHFLGMTAISLLPNAAEVHAPDFVANGIPGSTLATILGGFTAFILLLTISTAIFDSWYCRKTQAEAWQLSKYETLLSSMGEVAQIGTWEYDVETEQLVWSKQIRAMHKVEEDYEPDLEKASYFFPGPAKDAFLRAITYACENKTGFDMELPFSSYHNEELFVRVVCKALVTEEHPVKLVGAYQDVTRHKIERNALEHALSEAGKANQLKSEFLANMSHEIRTPMNGVLGMTQLLKTTELNDKQKAYAEVILSSGTALLELINDILDTSKIEAGLLQLHAEPFHLEEMLASAKGAVAGIALQKGLSVSYHMEQDVASHYMGDSPRIRQILINLMGNALKFTEQGRVSVAVSLDKARFLHFEVTDTGPGIPPEQQKHIFGRFTQADGSTTRKHGGTGLGLAISHDLVKMMGGAIGIYSQMGQGSTFWFRIPLQAVDVQAQVGAVA